MPETITALVSEARYWHRFGLRLTRSHRRGSDLDKLLYLIGLGYFDVAHHYLDTARNLKLGAYRYVS